MVQLAPHEMPVRGGKATAGKKVHGTGAIPGGMNKNLSIAERDSLLADVDQMHEWARGALSPF
ncbi:hypothetical protein LCGC14_0018900 [marine sediment metagenome]|uniref:Uncharacterized protein n=1 Tax=marine sediment metagenome TaxID=412755 RepID=A0A0F9Z2R9_9ZZZZ